jgi:CRP-like cAMP-binding protein
MATVWYSGMARFPTMLDRLNEKDRRDLLKKATLRQLQSKESINVQDEQIEKIYIINHGRVRTYYNYPDGHSITFAYWTDGMVMGLLGMSDWGQRYHWSSEAVCPTDLLCLSRENFVAMIKAVPEAAHCMIELMEFKSEYLSRLVRLMATHSVHERVFLALQNLAQFFGRRVDRGVLIDERFTHEEIAEMVGASRQWVTTAINALEQEGAVEVRKHRITVIKSNLPPKIDQPQEPQQRFFQTKSA